MLFSPITDTLQPRETKTYAVRFTPDDTTYQRGVIVFFHNAPGSADTVWVSGQGVDTPFFAGPRVLDFGEAIVGHVKQDCVTVVNPKQQPLTILQVKSSDPEFAVAPDSATVGSRGTTVFNISFAPTDSGNYASAAIFFHNAESSPDTVLLFGKGVADFAIAVSGEQRLSVAYYELYQNYPNPFNPATTIRYAIAKPGHVTLKAFNLQGQEIATLVNETKPSGEFQVQWNPANLASGVHVYRLQAGEFVATKKFVLVK